MSQPATPGPTRAWVLGARPRTLPASAVPVVAIIPEVAWMSWSYAVCVPRGPSWPNAVIEQ